MGQESTKPTIYSGTFERSMDAKNRVAIPSAWVAGEGEEFYVTPHSTEEFLTVMPPGEFQRMEQQIKSLAVPADVKAKMSRRFFGKSRLVTTDKQGRVLLPDDHCLDKGLKGEVVFIGTGSRFEIWSKANREKASASEAEICRQMAEEIGL